MADIFYEYLVEVLGEENVLLNEPMCNHTTFKVGGEADYFLKIGTKEQLATTVRYLRQVGIAYFVLGNGSNLLVGDKGYRGVILDLSGLNKIEINGERVTAEAGALLSSIAKMALDNELTGFEFAAGIPGSTGGAIVMNAGAYDGEMKKIVEEVTVLSESGEELILDNDTMEFGYRTSVIKNKTFIVLSVTFLLEPGKHEEILDKMQDLAKRRREKQPLEFPSAGSTFKRPEGNFAGKLIMDAGLRGMSIGGAKVSEKHCGFIINENNAVAADILELIEEVTERVNEVFGITLEPEVIRLGEF